jgi:HEAT repeat protein
MTLPERARGARCVRVLTLAGAFVAFLACGGPEERAPEAQPAAQRAKLRPAPAAREEKEGRVHVTRGSDGRFRVRARGASRFLVLQELARVAHFAIRPGAGSAPPLRLDLDLEGVSAEAALARILGDVPYHLDYGAGEAGGEVALRLVTVGLIPARPEARAGAPPPLAGERGGKARTGLQGSPRTPEERALGEEDRLAEIASKRLSRFDDERALAASLMRAEEQLPELAAMLSGDASAEVRASAAAALGEAEGGESAFRAVDALLGALGDSDPRVVAATLQALEDLHDLLPDPRMRAAVAPLARHGDPRVRDAAESFLEWTEGEP